MITTEEKIKLIQALTNACTLKDRLTHPTPAAEEAEKKLIETIKSITINI